MNLSNLPTDNLYKFMAIFGLIIFISSIIYPFSKINTCEQKQISVESELKKLRLEREYLGNSVKSAKEREEARFKHVTEVKNQLLGIEKKTVDLEANIQLYKLLESDKPAKERKEAIAKYLTEVKNQLLETAKYVTEIENQLLEIKKKTVDLEANIQLYKLLKSELRFLWYVAICGVFIGSLLMGIGFGTWQYKVQNYQDLILKNQANKNA